MGIILNTGNASGPMAAWGAVERNRGSERLAVHVKDRILRSEPGMDGFDGLERPFALIPHDDGSGNVTWRRVDMKYEGTEIVGRGGEDVDDYALYGDSFEQDAGAIQKYGVAFGMDTNVGTVWLQDANHNAR